jgi:hypothetical protein
MVAEVGSEIQVWSQLPNLTVAPTVMLKTGCRHGPRLTERLEG